MRHYRRVRIGMGRGTALLLAILVLTQITVAAVGLGTLVISSLQQARLLDSSVAAYYAAESAAEQAIYTVRRDDVFPDSDLDQRKAPSVTLDNRAKWERTVTAGETDLVIRLPQDAGYEIDLIDFDKDLTDDQPEIAWLRMTWVPPAGCDMADTCPILEVSAVSFDPNVTDSWEKMSGLDQATSDSVFETIEYSGVTTPFYYGSMTRRFTDGLAVVGLTPGRLNIVRLRAEAAAIDRLTVRALNESGVQLAVPGRVKIDTVGRMGGTEQRLTVRMPRRPPLMGIYNFAVFSECSLVKGHPIRCP
jgi:hypothetical protein